jgi:hypothetical protein
VGLLDLIEEHDGVRAAADGLGQLPSLLVADVAVFLSKVLEVFFCFSCVFSRSFLRHLVRRKQKEKRAEHEKKPQGAQEVGGGTTGAEKRRGEKSKQARRIRA